MDETIKHLELIQGVINRMAQVSFILKGWAVTLVVALLAVVANTTNSWYGLLGLLPALVFWAIDAYYLRQERLFRRLYDRVRLGPGHSGIPTFSMDTSVVSSDVDQWWRTLSSWALIGVYGTLSAISIITVIVVHYRGDCP